jgi:hypothetical protein
MSLVDLFEIYRDFIRIYFLNYPRHLHPIDWVRVIEAHEDEEVCREFEWEQQEEQYATRLQGMGPEDYEEQMYDLVESYSKSASTMEDEEEDEEQEEPQEPQAPTQLAPHHDPVRRDREEDTEEDE